ncbi:DMT family transporter [Paenibacillus faecalis]|uniref:DMT family transporter n=1 Tax=Paenibacillus faecalis TaxID=2079532 RepID=UPI000D1057C6|nr:multidrug efflux SMR transporter [Paenibacillus faecalis]
MHWIYLTLAILFEIAGTTSMKLSEGFTRLVPSILLVLFYLGSLAFLTLTLKKIDVSVAYAIWSGMGIVLIAIIGFFYFNEQFSFVKLFAILLIVIGVVTLNLTVQKEESPKEATYQSSNERINL